MFNVCLFNPPEKKFDINDCHVETFDPMAYFDGANSFTTRDFIAGGLNGYIKRRALIHAEGVDRLFRDRDPAYMRMIRDFLDRFHDFDLVVMGTYNFIHPEILIHELRKPIKILGFVDDPHSTYVRGIPYLWAFDGAFYISPSYDERFLFDEALKIWGCEHTYWWPLTQPFPLPERGEEFFVNRSKDVVYVGNPTLTKIDRLIDLKKHFDRRLHIHGRWRAHGYYGLLRGLLGQRIYWNRVTSLTSEARASLYYNTKIGFNMHVSEKPVETGNMRMYETPAHGLLQICDKAARNAHELIFVPDKEAVYYDDLPDAIAKIEYYLVHEKERIEIAWAGYERVRQSYKWEDNILKFINWAMTLPKRNIGCA
jgi:hypothetical protein